MPPKLSPADFFRSRPPGARHWLDTFGASMSPFLHTGDAVLVERGATAIAGDIALLARADGQLVAHLVTCAQPLRTSTLLGFEDPPGLELLGRAVAVRARGVELAVGPALRRSLVAAHSVLSVGRARQAVHKVLSSKGVRAVRRRVLRPEVRLLTSADEPLALRALGDLGAPFAPDALRLAFARGFVAGAHAQGRLWALLAVLPARSGGEATLHLSGTLALARDLGLERHLAALAVAEARARGLRRLTLGQVADSSLAALAGVGFAADRPGLPWGLTLDPSSRL